MRISPDQKRRQAEKIRCRVTELLSSVGFHRLRSTSWVRETEHLIQRIHLHLFTFDSSFRVHLSIHVRSFSEEESVLNGIQSFDGWYEHPKTGLRKPRKYVFRFNRLDESVEKCALELFAYCQDVAEPWFQEHGDPHQLLSRSDSPLSEPAQRALKRRLAS